MTHESRETNYKDRVGERGNLIVLKNGPYVPGTSLMNLNRY